MGADAIVAAGLRLDVVDNETEWIIVQFVILRGVF